MARVTGSEFCFNHDPGKARERAVARKAGGESRHSPHGGELGSVASSPRSIPDLFGILDYALAETLALDTGIQRGHLLKSIVMTYADLFKVGELEQRIAALEAKRK
jgi:hypothetical protein